MYSASDEMIDKSKSDVIIGRGIEVGHIFNFGTKYTKPLECFVLNQDGKRITPYMGSYGIGVSRLTAAIIEAFHDEKGIKWPINISPFKINIIIQPNSTILQMWRVFIIYLSLNMIMLV